MDEAASELVRERDAALLSLDEGKIREYFAKYSSRPQPADPEVFWVAVRKAITACRTLPVEFRREAKKWLAERGYSPWDDGDL